MSEDTQEFQLAQDQQVERLKSIMAENYIPLDHKAIERAICHPKFKWEDTIEGKVSYPGPGVGLMHNLFPKERKKGGKAKKSAAAKSPKKKKEK